MFKIFLVVFLMGFPSFAFADLLIDSYIESNNDNFTELYFTGVTARSQSFANTSIVTLNSSTFYLSKAGNPTGNMYAKIYAHTGTYGTNSAPVGSALATSDAIDVATLSTSYALVTFTFSGVNKVLLNESTYYSLVFEFLGGNGTNKVKLGLDTSAPAHSGNAAYYLSGAWTAQSNVDCIFYIHGITPAPVIKARIGSGHIGAGRL